MKNRGAIIGAVGAGVVIGIMLFSMLPEEAEGQSVQSGRSLEQTKLLGDINRGVQDIQRYIREKESGNMAFMSQGLEQAEVYVWDNQSRKWYRQLLAGQGQRIFESNGNFCAYARAGNKIHFAAWNKRSKKWSPLVRHGETIEIIPCDGNFGYFTSNQEAGVWTPQTEKWDTQRTVGTYVTTGGADIGQSVENLSENLTKSDP